MTWAFMFGAGDENRTRALSLGITALLGVVGALTSGNECQGEALSSPWHPLLTLVYRPVGHASGTDAHAEHAELSCSQAAVGVPSA
jgi:hypothetical protein